MKSAHFFHSLFILSALVACEKATHTAGDFKPYDGPIAMLEKVNLYYSDSARVKVKMKAPVENEYLNGNRIFPKGIDLTFFDILGDTNAILTSNYAIFDKNTGIYTVRGNVVIIGIKEYKKINTEELFWNPTTKQVYTEKFVRIETKEEILTGNGLTASQDFKTYRITKPTGIFSVKEQ